MPTRSECANAIRALSMDAVQKANSGHPGAPMGMADIAQVLWSDHLKHNPKSPNWPNRDRFVLSNGHASMLLYSLLHLTGYELSIEDIQQFRQLHAKTAGHPEHGYAPGIETTTGPLGQGLANAVGMALAEKTLAAQFNESGYPIVDHFTYVFAGDGCLMEGISHEVASFAGTHQLGKLIVFYDDNGISIDGNVAGWFTDDTVKRFESYGWQVIRDVDGHDFSAIDSAIQRAKEDTAAPTIICCKTVIGQGAPNKAGTHHTHGAPLGAEEIAATREALGWTAAAFDVPDEIRQAWSAVDKGAVLEGDWEALFAQYAERYPEKAAEFRRRMAGDLPDNWTQFAESFLQQAREPQDAIATRKASLVCLNDLVPELPELLGGSADLTDSNLTKAKTAVPISRENQAGNYLFYGVREFGMSAIMNGMALYGGFIPFGGTFLVFMDYARNAVRMAALMKQRVVFVYTHDSIGLGEDGPTHQPVEHLTTLRVTPNMTTWRPADLFETAVAWRAAIEKSDGPSTLVLSRQGLPQLLRDAAAIKNTAKGGYILKDCEGEPEVILIATGSEVSLACDVHDYFREQNARVRVVSMPSAEVFAEQSAEYQASVLPPAVTQRIAIEAAHPDYWYKFVGITGKVIGVNTFGESAPGKVVMEQFGLTRDNIIHEVKAFLNQK